MKTIGVDATFTKLSSTYPTCNTGYNYYMDSNNKVI
jgi:hypothetical protein